ncbi:hypothetical protein [Roseivirga echinicomitans]|uniref:Outer membrane protein beta-barrel domain-containing protein n=1 Tax=Roseivirga echinicomitans TaxID=296218 RepID=A0A150XXQ9_9BACT|nr:hypothetical protein [Roseivirga echinicomitans]KYG83513.1 hypothetical protein AWN68_01535 [Roseivirga echinicomitans]
MLKNIIKYSALLGAFLFCTTLKAQYTQSSYSAFGIGDVNWGGYSHNAGMGGFGISYNNRLYLNNLNPALVATNFEAVFQIGTSFDSRTYNNGDQSYSSFTGGFKDFGFSLPIKYGKWNMALGLSPYTSVNYGILQTSTGPDNSILLSQLDGNGGIDEAFMTHALRLGNLMVGLKTSYLFGSIERDTEYLLTGIPTITFSSTIYNERRSFSDVTANIGLAYKLEVKERQFINFGAFYNLEANVRSRNLTRLESQDINGNVLSSDTLKNNVDSQISIPQRIGFGISYEKSQRFAVGIDVQTQAWSQYLDESGQTSSNFGDAFRIAVGGELLPNYEVSKAGPRITYRFGIHYERTPYLINSQEVNDFGINIGTSLPLNGIVGVSNLNLGATFGNRGNVTDGLIRENYLKLSIGFSLQDQTWFARQKYN